jgi:hypothetical protein
MPRIGKANHLTITTAIKEKISKLDLSDAGILGHGFMPYRRDYYADYEIGGPTLHAGRYRCIFTHCVSALIQTSVHAKIWRTSWGDEFIDYKKWLESGEPEGFVWGTNWSLGYPGLSYIEGSKPAALWGKKLEREMHEVILGTDAFRLQLLFHNIKIEKLGSDVELVDRVVFPFKRRKNGE